MLNNTYNPPPHTDNVHKKRIRKHIGDRDGKIEDNNYSRYVFQSVRSILIPKTSYHRSKLLAESIGGHHVGSLRGVTQQTVEMWVETSKSIEMNRNVANQGQEEGV